MKLTLFTDYSMRVLGPVGRAGDIVGVVHAGRELAAIR